MISALVLSLALQANHPRSILAFSKTTGFRHDAIPVARKALVDVAIDHGWTIAFTEDAGVFKKDRLKNYDAVIFLMTTGDILDPEEKKAFIGFIHNGGGYVGIHSAADTEYKWPWYEKLVGAWFLQHPAQADAVVKIEDTADPAMSFLPNPWKRHDEWYDYRANPRANVHVLASLDQSSYKGSKMGDDHPITWDHEFEGGRSWYTGMGHTQESWADPLYLKMVYEGIEWACQKSKRN